MPAELSSFLRLKARRSLEDRECCSGCARVPLAGELLHELTSHELVCQLCLAALPERARETIATRRVHASNRPLAIAPRAA